MTSHRMVILTEGCTSPTRAKTAACIVRYRPDDVLALLDTTCSGRTAGELLGVGGALPIIGSLDEVADADTLVIGIAPSGGKIPQAWRPFILEALRRGMSIVSGLHDQLTDDHAFVAAAEAHSGQLIDIRRTTERECSQFMGFREECLRILTVGQDCSLGKMLVSVELARALKRAGHDTKFVATGQTGILIEGDGCPIDCVVSDFVSGAVERLILRNQDHEILIVEGQGSLVHPKYSGVTLSLLHGCVPQGMILCYEVGRKTVHGMPHVPLTPLAKVRDTFEMMANLLGPSRVIGIAMNSSTVTPEETEMERERIRDEFGLPVCDVIRHGPDALVDAVLNLRRERMPHLYV
ncbi:MAG: DUF1611 domain-containing protein [Pirellulales bacterium]|nr:DUF1611 domain-containing protein [Pirellulales bacterium]